MRLIDAVGLAVGRGMRLRAEKRGFLLPVALGANAVDVAERAIDRARDTRRTMDAALEPAIPPGPGKHAAFGGLTGPPKGLSGRAQASRPSGFPGSRPVSSGAGGGMPSWLSGLGRAAAGAIGEHAAEGAGRGIGALAGSPLSGVGKVVEKGLDHLFFRPEFGEQKDPFHMAGTAAVQTFGKGVGEMGVDLLKDIASKAMAAVGNVGQDAARQAILSQLKRTDPILAEADDKVLMDAYHTMVRFAPVLSTDANAVRSFLRTAVMAGAGPDFASIKQLADAERAVTGRPKE